MNWIEQGEGPEHSDVIKHARKLRKECDQKQKERDYNIQQSKLQRLIETYQKKDKQSRNKLEKKIAELMKNPNLMLDEIWANLPDFDEHMHRTVLQILKSPTDFVGQKVVHTWFDNGTENKYNGQIVKLKRRNTVYVIGYWTEEETVDDSEDYDIHMKQLICDNRYDDLRFQRNICY